MGKNTTTKVKENVEGAKDWVADTFTNAKKETEKKAQDI